MKYEAPRAVRLADSATAQFQCVNGPHGNTEICDTGNAVGGNRCWNGDFVAR